MDEFSPLKVSAAAQRRQQGYNLQDQHELVSQLQVQPTRTEFCVESTLNLPSCSQASNFDLKMEVHGLQEEMNRLRKGGATDKSEELERNKALLVKARHAIGKLQVTV